MGDRTRSCPAIASRPAVKTTDSTGNLLSSDRTCGTLFMMTKQRDLDTRLADILAELRELRLNTRDDAFEGLLCGIHQCLYEFHLAEADRHKRVENYFREEEELQARKNREKFPGFDMVNVV